jgi:hypothetical protein
MAQRTSASLKQAFKQFVELVKPIDDVRYVVASDAGGPEISTYITELDEDVSTQVFHAEYRIMDDFPELPVDFHVWYLEGKSLEDFVRQLPPLVYSRQPAPNTRDI